LGFGGQISIKPFSKKGKGPLLDTFALDSMLLIAGPPVLYKKVQWDMNTIPPASGCNETTIY